MKSFQAQTHYEVLEISVGASPAEVRGAYERLSLLYSDDQVVLYGLINPSQAVALRNRLKEALEVLSDDQRRESYDLKIGLPPRVVATPKAVPRPSAPQSQALGASAGTGWGTFAWVTPGGPPQTPTQPASYTYAVTPTISKPAAAAPPPVLVVPVPARVLAVAPTPPMKLEVAPPPAKVEAPAAPAPIEAPVFVAPPAESPPEPRQLALDVASGVTGWGLKSIPAPAPDPVPAPAAPVAAPLAPPPSEVPSAPVLVVAPSVSPPPVAPDPSPTPEPAVIPEPAPLAVEAPPVVEEPPIPILADDAQVAIIPARATPSREFRVEQKPRPYEIPEGVEINGDLLKQVRMAKGLSLIQVAERTRIGVKHLENVEGDRYDALPAAVYLRGILMNLARELGLDGLRVSRSYLTFVEAHRSKG